MLTLAIAVIAILLIIWFLLSMLYGEIIADCFYKIKNKINEEKEEKENE